MRFLSFLGHGRRALFVAGALALLVPITATARPSPPGRDRLKPPVHRSVKTAAGRSMLVKPAPSQRIIFEDDVVSAGRGLGGGTLIDGEKRVRFSRLIPIRANFVDMLIKAGEDL